MSDPLPLTDLAFNILVALSNQDLHGYALVKQLRELDGREGLRTGTVYAALARLQDAGWVADAEPPDHAVDSRRKYYRITSEGVVTARSEAARLRTVLARAGKAALLQDATGG
ncbi:MAG: PadR family transcriptional regulator [Longimicrobiales bacterium]|nr:PadR family transcriptional regulator [Longimicrobiales bacterium]